jgi:membrane associated rhomboid family serine protease
MKTTHLLVVLNVLVFAALALAAPDGAGEELTAETLVGFGALFPPLVRGGELWRLGSMIFMHVSLLHLVLNSLALLQVGAILEAHYGRGRLLALYVAAGLGGALTSVVLHFDTPVVSVGASGAITGLVGAGALSGHLVARRVGSGPGAVLALLLRNAMLRWLALLGLMAIGLEGIDHAAHLGGLVVGLGAAWLFDGGGRFVRRRGGVGVGPEGYALVVAVAALFAVAARAQTRSAEVARLVRSGAAAAKAGRLDDATRDFRAAAALGPGEPVAHYDLGLVRLEQGDRAEAERALRRAVMLDPRYVAAWSALADVLKQEGRLDEAAQARARAEELVAARNEAGRGGSDGGAASVRSAADAGAASVRSATDGGAASVQSATDGGAASVQSATDGGAASVQSAEAGQAAARSDGANGGTTQAGASSGAATGALGDSAESSGRR